MTTHRYRTRSVSRHTGDIADEEIPGMNNLPIRTSSLFEPHPDDGNITRIDKDLLSGRIKDDQAAEQYDLATENQALRKANEKAQLDNKILQQRLGQQEMDMRELRELLRDWRDNRPVPPSLPKSSPFVPLPAHSAQIQPRFPDPEKLSDGKEPSFRSWEIQVKIKLNSDLLQGDIALHYVYSRTTGRANALLTPRMDTISPFALHSADDALDALRKLFVDPHHRYKQARAYKFIRYLPSSMTYLDFYTKFINLAAESGARTEDMKMDLFQALPQNMQVQLSKEAFDDMSDFDTFQNTAQNIAYVLESNRWTPNTNKPLTHPNEISPSPIPRPYHTTSSNSKGRPVYSSTERQVRSDLGQCFSCGQKGHFAIDCKAAKQPAITNTNQLGSRIEEIQEDAKN